MTIENVALVHGWGLNKAIWLKYVAVLQEHLPTLKFHLIDIPGYGELAHIDSPACIKELARGCLEQAPEQAMWVGWSLGGMIALQAALFDLEPSAKKVPSANEEQVPSAEPSANEEQEPSAQKEPSAHERKEPSADKRFSAKRVQALQLINATPKFVQADDWPSGVDIAIFDKFCNELSSDYERTLGMFLLLQAGASKGSRALARDAQQAISQYANPSELSLRRGIECLADVDLRSQLEMLSLPTQIISGSLDRVTKPESSRALSQMVPSELIELHSGHAPFLTNVDSMLKNFERFLNRVEVCDAA